MRMMRAIGVGIAQTLVVVGLVVFTVGGIAWSFSDDPASTSQETGTTSTTAAPVTSSTAPGSTSTAPGSTSSTAPLVTTSSTTTPSSPNDVEAFILEFSAALEAGDATWLLGRLHPVVIAKQGASVCQQFINDTILLMSDYRIDGPVETSAQVFDVDGEQVTVDPYYTAPVLFTFQGETISGIGAYAPTVDVMNWFTECRSSDPE